MNQAQESGRLTNFEWFGLISGIIGLIADTISLSSLFRNSQVTQTSLIFDIHVTSFVQWLITFFGISYTVLIVGFFARRVMLRKYTQRREAHSYEKKKAVERGAVALTYLIGIPLFLLHFLLLFYIIRENIVGVDPEHLKRLMGESDTTDAIHSIGVRWAVFGPMISILMTMLMDYVSDTIYSALNKVNGEAP